MNFMRVSFSIINFYICLIRKALKCQLLDNLSDELDSFVPVQYNGYRLKFTDQILVELSLQVKHYEALNIPCTACVSRQS